MKWIQNGTQIWTSQHGRVAGRRRPRVKRTFNLTEWTVDAIREMALLHEVADSQDAVVELAIEELRRQVADRQEALLWARAATDEWVRTE